MKHILVTWNRKKCWFRNSDLVGDFTKKIGEQNGHLAHARVCQNKIYTLLSYGTTSNPNGKLTIDYIPFLLF